MPSKRTMIREILLFINEHKHALFPILALIDKSKDILRFHLNSLVSKAVQIA